MDGILILDERWQIYEEVGSGTYGSVYLGINTTNNQKTAIKKMRTCLSDDGIPIDTLREIILLKSISHENIINLIDVVCHEDYIYLILEFMEKDLKTFIKSFEGDINMNIIKGIMKRILQGLSYLHLQGIFHRDLKPQNIMINTNDHKLEVKIVDFGLARTYSMIERDYTINSMTPLYRAPEVFLGISNYSAEVDMWSVGCIFAELLLKSPLFIGQQEMDVITRILRLFGVFSIDVLGLDRILSNVVENSVWEELFPMLDKDGIDLISRMLILDPKKRIKADEAIEHSFFKDVQ